MEMFMSQVPATQPRHSLIAKFADKYSVDASKLMDTLKATAFKQSGDKEISNEQMAALLIVSDQYGLNPFTREIYAFPDKGGIVPVIGVDGWARIVNEHPQCDGFEFAYSDETMQFSAKDVPVWMEVHFFRKDRQRPVIVREYFDEVVRKNMPPWQSHPNRMMRHKTFVQGARLAFGFAGVFDEDEGERIVERSMGSVEEVPQPVAKSTRTKPAPALEDMPSDSLQFEQAEPTQRAAVRTQRSAAPAQRQQVAAKPAAREPGSDDEEGEIPGNPIPDNMLRVIKSKMEQGALGEADLLARFGYGYGGITTINYNDVIGWIEDPVAA
jgi:phage recombination protein Bet